MRLVKWRKSRGLTQADLAAKLGVTQPYVSSMERAINPAVPGPPVMIALYELTGGAVQPNDFYDLPDLPSRTSEAA